MFKRVCRICLFMLVASLGNQTFGGKAKSHANLFDNVRNDSLDNADVQQISFDVTQRAFDLFAANANRDANLRVNGFPITESAQANLILRPFNVMPEGGHAQAVGPNGAVRFFKPRVALYTGFVEGVPGSYAYLAVSEKMTNGLIMMGESDVYVVSSGDPLAATPGRVSVGRMALAAHHLHEWACGMGDALHGELAMDAALPPTGLSQTMPHVRFGDVFIEGDHAFRALFETAEDAADYVVTLIGVVSDIYRRDIGVELHLQDGYVRIWEEVPPWGIVFDHNSGVCAVMTHWGDNCQTPFWNCNANMCDGLDDCFVNLPPSGDPVPCTEIVRAAVHLFTHTNPLYGGAAADFGGICDNSIGYEGTAMRGFFPLPLQHQHEDNWDVFACAHEFGHSFDSFHSFDYGIPCVDGTGPDQGTIMSYCFNTFEDTSPVGMRFHPFVQGVMRDFVPTAGCLDVFELQAGDYNHDDAIDEQDLQVMLQCLNQGFISGGCFDMFDFDRDEALEPEDFCALATLIDPEAPNQDCNSNSQADCLEIGMGTSSDCNFNLVPDLCDVAGPSLDCNDNDVPDECESSGLPGDINCDQNVNLLDFAEFPGCVTGPGGDAVAPCIVFDFDLDGDVDWADFALMQIAIGT